MQPLRDVIIPQVLPVFMFYRTAVKSLLICPLEWEIQLILLLV